MTPFTDFVHGDKPNEAELRLIEAVRDGTVADCSDLTGEEKKVDARLIAALATGRFVDDERKTVATTEFGLFLVDATVPNRLNLESFTVPHPFIIYRCNLEKALDFDSAHFYYNLIMRNSIFQGECRLVGTRIDGHFSADSANFENRHGIAIDAQELTASGWSMSGARVIGTFKINLATLGGQFSAENALFKKVDGCAVNAQGIKAKGWFMNNSRVIGRFDISGATILSTLTAQNTTFENAGSLAICAEGIKAIDCFMHGARVIGEFNITSAALDGQLSAIEFELDNAGGRAILASYSKFNGGIFLRGKSSCHGSIILDRTEINIALDLRGLTVSSLIGWSAINLNGATVNGDTILDEGTVEGTKIDAATLIGAFKARRAKFNGGLFFGKANLTAASLAHRDCLFMDSESKTPEAPAFEGRHMAIDLTEARIDGRLVMPNDSANVRGIVDLSRARCDTLEDFSDGWPAPWPQAREGRVELCDGRECFEEDRRTVDVQHLDLDGFEFAHLANPAGVDGRREPDASASDGIAKARIRWLEAQSRRALVTDFNPQPWRQTAKVLREMGYDEEAREVSVRRRVRQRQAATTPFPRRVVSLLLHVTSDYGFNPWKTVGWSVGVIAAFFAIYWTAASHCALPGCRDGSVFSPIAIAERDPTILVPQPWRTPRPLAAVSEDYPPFLPALFSLDTFLPLIPLGIEDDWAPNADFTAPGPIYWLTGGQLGTMQFPWGRVLLYLMVLQELLGAVLLAIAISGFTGLLTRDER